MLEDVKARDVMVADLITVSPDAKIAYADLLMTRHSIGGLPVVEGEKLVGIITQRDIMYARSYSVGNLEVRDLMSKEVITVEPETPLKEILRLMLDNKIERIPVVKDGKLLGLVVHNKILKKVYEVL
ncbi:MAG: inosine-5-monophosphate dehydrogenase [Thermoplasmata archaeon]|nr:MAG: inosine-5-monophosphate dehydrogenase [Thermoplasmata archaeon]